MTEYGEELLHQRLWHWLETQKGMEVDGEVDIGVGRIDLVAEHPDGEVWGIEVKTKNYDLEQADRYTQSGRLDRLYLASGYDPDPEDHLAKAAGSTDFVDRVTVDNSILSQTKKRLGAGVQDGRYTGDEIAERIEAALTDEQLDRSRGSRTIQQYVQPAPENIDYRKDPISLETGVRRIRRFFEFLELGIIQLPPCELEAAISPGDAPDPIIVREADTLERDERPDFDCRGEPWVRHAVWEEYGGIPEGHVPNVMDSDQPYRPIDLIAFEGSIDPVDAVQNPDENAVLGFEAKGSGSYSKDRLRDQLSEYLQTECFSELYVAIPDSFTNRALNLLDEEAAFSDIGVVSVTTAGEVTVDRPAGRMIPQHDGYMENHESRKTGYGERDIQEGKDVTAPYVTKEEAQRLEHTDPTEYALDLLSDDSARAGPDGCISPDEPIDAQPTREALDEQTGRLPSASRVYVGRGETYALRQPMKGTGHGQSGKVTGHIELRLDYHAEQNLLLLNLGRNYGGYVWFTGEETDQLQTILHSLAYIEGGTAHGQGYMKGGGPGAKPRPGYAGEHEKPVALQIISQVTDLKAADLSDPVLTFKLGKKWAPIIEIELTTAQWFDLIASIDILRNGDGSERELPRQEPDNWGYARIGPSGELIEENEDIDYREDVLR